MTRSLKEGKTSKSKEAPYATLQTNQWFTLLETFYRLRRKKMILKVTFPPSDRYSKRKKEQKKKYYSAPRNRINKRHICVQSSFLLERNFFLRPHLPKFFMQLLVYPVTVFCLGMPKLQVSHMCIQKAENSICYVV